MRYRKAMAISVVAISCQVVLAKDKKKVLLPVDVLQAHNVLVMVDPDAGVDTKDPNANRTARQDVELSLVKWGRLNPVTEARTADLIIVVRKGNGKMAQSTIGGTPANGSPPVTIGSSTTPDSTTTRAGGRWGNAGTPGDPSTTQDPSPTPYPQTEIGQTQDSFAVYRAGHTDTPLDAPAVWRYTAKNALESPDVPAVEVFRKLIAESEKQQ